jgi:hypothetical protein
MAPKYGAILSFAGLCGAIRDAVRRKMRRTPAPKCDAVRRTGGVMIVAARMIALYVAAIGGHIGDAGKALARAPRLEPPPMQTALASWYDDSGSTASGRHYTYGFASLLFGSDWGRRVRFCYRGCAIGELDDHGPYVGGRLFDLNWRLKTAIGCPDLCVVRWR